jgi:hypothetical protein
VAPSGDRATTRLLRSSILDLRSSILAVLTLLALAGPGRAQQPAARDELLALVPPDVGFCLLVNDLRGHAQKWDRSPWLRSLRESPLVKTILESPEAGQIAALEAELKKHLGVDWPTLRDDIFGDAVVVAYRPGTAAQPDQEQGMIALRAARPKLLAELVDRVNQGQESSGELKELQPVKHLGATYYRRAHVRKNHYYYLRGPFLVVAGSEAMLRQAIERDLDRNGREAAPGPWPARFRRAGAAQALATVGINPRAFELFPAPAQGEKPQGFAGLWRALDGIFVSLEVDATLELRLDLQGRSAEMPAWARPMFTQTPAPSVLWQRFPEPAILTVADRTDFAAVASQLLALMPPAERGKLTEGLQGGLGLFTRLDLLRDVLPNVGPDWGMCILPPAEGAAFPEVIAALAVRPGGGVERVDESLFKGAQFLAGLAVADHNRKNPGAPIRIESVQQGKVTVKYLRQDQLFPPGFRPAGALKDGFLLFATSPGAIARFTSHAATVPTQGEAPLLRVSPAELANLLRLRRAQVLLDLRHKHQLSAEEAEQRLEQILGLLERFDAVTISQRGEPGQAGWVLRVVPRVKS